MVAPVTKAEFLKVLKKTVTFTGHLHNYVPTEQNLQTFLQQLLVYKDKLYRALEFLLLFEGSEDSLPTCDSKPQGLLRLISDSVPFEYIKNLMDADGNTKRYKDVYEFFKRVTAQSAEFDSLTKAARKFSTAFSGAVFAASERNHQHHLSDTEVKGAQGVTSATKAVPTGAVVPYQKWPRRTVAVMESVEEENDENIDPVNNFDPEDSEDDFGETDSANRDKEWYAFGVSPRIRVQYLTMSIHTTVTSSRLPETSKWRI